MYLCLTHCIHETPKKDTLANSEAPDEMQHHAAFHQGLHCLLKLKQLPGTQKNHTLVNFTSDPLKYAMDIPIPIVSICMSKSIKKGLKRLSLQL